MAIYSASSSGNLKIANTGLTSPVSFSAYNGLASTTIAGGPTVGQQSIVWLARGITPTAVASSGSLRLSGYLIRSQSAISSSALGELPLTGGSDNITYTTVTKAVPKAVVQSSGSLKLTGSTSSAVTVRRSSAGSTKLTGSTLARAIFKTSSAGSTKLTGATVSTRIFNKLTAGNLTLTGSSVGFLTGILRSTGSLKLTGTTVSHFAVQRQTSGTLLLPSVTLAQAMVQRQTAGSTKLTGNTLARAIFKTSSAGLLNLTGTDFDNEIFLTTSAGQLKLSGPTANGQNFVYKRYNKATNPGSLKLTGSSYSNIILKTNSSGQLLVSTEYYYPTYLGGIATNSIASNLDDLPARLLTTVTSFYGSNLSRGSLKITPTGEIVRSLSQSSGIAGSALSDDAIAAGLDTIRRASTFTMLYNTSSIGSLHIRGPSTAIQYDNDTAGNLVLTGAKSVGLGSTTSGNLVTNGSNTTVRTLLFNSQTGNLYIGNDDGYVTRPLSDSSSIAGSAIASAPLGGSTDFYLKYLLTRTLGFNSNGNLVTSGNHISVRTLLFQSSGNLTLTGVDVFKEKEQPTSAGNLVTSGNHISVRTLLFQSNGNLRVGDTNGFTTRPLSDSSSIAGASIASIPIGGADDFYQVFNWSKTQGFNTDNQILKLSGTTGFAKTITILSSGRLVVNGVSSFGQQKYSSGNLVTSGNHVSVRTLHFNSSGSIKLSKDGYAVNDLTSGGTIAGGAVASKTIAGHGAEEYRSIQLSLANGRQSSGLLTLRGYETPTRTLDFSTAGNLILSGSSTNGRKWEKGTAGLATLTGSTSRNTTWKPTSSGILKITEVTPAAQSGIAASSLAEFPLTGTIDTKLLFIQAPGSEKWRRSAGNLVLTVTDQYRLVVKPKSPGQLTLTGADQTLIKINATSSGTLKLSGVDLSKIKLVETTPGYLKLYGADHVNINLVEQSSGNLKLYGVDLSKIKLVETTPGYLKLSASDSYGQIVSAKSNGQLTVSGIDLTKVKLVETTPGYLKLSASDSYEQIVSTKSNGELKLYSSDQHNITISATSAGTLTLLGLTSYSIKGIQYFESYGRMKLSSSTKVAFVRGINSHGNITTVGSHVNNNVFSQVSNSNVALVTDDAYQLKLNKESSGNLELSGTHTNSVVFSQVSNTNVDLVTDDAYQLTLNEDSAGQSTVTASTEYQLTLNEDSAGQSTITTESKYNVRSIVSSIGSLGVLGGLEEFTAVKKRTSGQVKLSGQSNIVISLKPGTSGFTIISGSTISTANLIPINREHVGGSGIYYGPWGAPFVLPFANTYYEKEGKRRRSRVAVAVRFSRVDRWKRSAIDTRLLPQDVRVAVHIPTQEEFNQPVPTDNRPKVTVNAKTLKFIKSHAPNIDLTNFSLVENKEVTVEDILSKSNVVDTSNLKETSYSVGADKFKDRSTFKIQVTMPNDQQPQPYAVDVDLSNS